jgi:hypothetical protein
VLTRYTGDILAFSPPVFLIELRALAEYWKATNTAVRGNMFFYPSGDLHPGRLAEF